MITLFEMVKDFSGNFYTRVDELINAIEQAGENIAVVDYNDEYLTVANYDTDEEVIAYLGHANSTLWIYRVKEA